MRSCPFILRCSAFLLIVVFSQKTGAGLIFHNLLHTSNTTNESPANQSENGIGFSYACSCVDDFLTPFVEAEEPAGTQLISDPLIPVVSFEDQIPFSTTIYSPLRGPPAKLL
jgi:hypothetical protein